MREAVLSTIVKLENVRPGGLSWLFPMLHNSSAYNLSRQSASLIQSKKDSRVPMKRLEVRQMTVSGLWDLFLSRYIVGSAYEEGFKDGARITS